MPLGKLWCEVNTGKNRADVPEPPRREIFEQSHSLSHPGIRGTTKLITARYFWPNMNRNTSHWSRACIPCQKAKEQTY